MKGLASGDQGALQRAAPNYLPRPTPRWWRRVCGCADLAEAGLNRLPASQCYKRKVTRWKRYEKQRPGPGAGRREVHRTPIGQQARKTRYNQYTAIDDCTRLRVLRTYPCNDQNTANAFMDHIRSKLPFAADQIQTDKDQESAPSSTGTYRVMNRHVRPSATA